MSNSIFLTTHHCAFQNYDYVVEVKKIILNLFINSITLEIKIILP